MKTCSKCKSTLPKEEFSKQAGKKDGRKSHCKSCTKVAAKAYRAKKARELAYRPKPCEITTKKRCAKCGIEKPIRDFHVNKAALHGRSSTCKKCALKTRRDWYQDPEKKQRFHEYMKQYYVEKRDEILAKKKEYHAANRDRIVKRGTAYAKKRCLSDPMYHMAYRARRRVIDAFRKNGYKKKCKTSEMLGCTWPQLVEHLESQFQSGMTWENRGEWHVDHIVPLASAETEDELLKLCHYTNLQPLWATENLRKGAKLDWDNQ